MPLLPKCRCKLANGCHESYDSRLHFVCVRCVALHLRDDQLRIKSRMGSGDSPRVGSGESPHLVGRRGQSPNGQFQRRAAGTVPVWSEGDLLLGAGRLARASPRGGGLSKTAEENRTSSLRTSAITLSIKPLSQCGNFSPAFLNHLHLSAFVFFNFDLLRSMSNLQFFSSLSMSSEEARAFRMASSNLR